MAQNDATPEAGGGATPNPTPTPAEPSPATPATGETPPEPLGAAGMKALEAERAARREAESRLKELEPLAAKARELEESQKTELEKITEARAAAVSEAARERDARLRLEIAIEKAPEGMPIAKIRKLADRLRGDDRETMEADADELFAEFGNPTPAPPERRPGEHLTPGTPNPETDPPVDADKLAEKIFSRNRI